MKTMKGQKIMQVLEKGTYTRYQTPDGTVLEVFQPSEVQGKEPDQLVTGKTYYLIEDDSIPQRGPFDTEQEALAAGADEIEDQQAD